MPGDDLDLLLSAIREAGDLALSLKAKGFGHKQKADGTFVTDVDVAVDTLLKQRITSARPEDGWLSEETPDNSERLPKKRLWISDPIDGTRGFLQGTGPWGIGMGLLEGNSLACAAVFLPEENRFFHAQREKGLFLNGTRLKVKSGSRRVISPKRLTASLASAGFTPELNSPVPLLLRLALIASGEVAAAISSGDKNDWDIAAGHLLVTEMGGMVTRLDGSPVVYNQPSPWQPGLVAAADKDTHAAIMQALRGT